MIVVLASRYDQAAGRLAARWAGAGGCLMTCDDLSAGGWRYQPNLPTDGTAVVAGREVPVKDIRGVLTRLPCVTAHEVLQIASADRGYVAAEMTAFLSCWLSTLPCPVLNRPSPGHLAGPNLHAEQWALAAAKLGMRLLPARVRLGLDPSPGEPAEGAATVTVVGGRCFGEADEELLGQASRLARVTGVDLLGVRFAGAGPGAPFVGASTSPDADTPEVADAILDYLTAPTAARDRRPGSKARQPPRRSASPSSPDST